MAISKTAIIQSVVEETGLTKKASKEAVEATLAAIKKAISAGDDVVLFEFGTFKVKNTKERTVRNPATGEASIKPAGRKLVFNVAPALKEAL